MDAALQERHRPGALKQQNKSHKTGNHKSKGAIHKVQKGKVNSKTITKKFRKELRRTDRRNQSTQLRKKKHEEFLSKRRSLGGIFNAPFLVAVIPISEDIDPLGAIELLKQADPESLVKTTTQGNVHINVPRFKQRFTLVSPRVGDLNAILDALKVADTVIFLASVTDGLGDVGEAIMNSTLAQRLPTPIVAVIDLDSVPLKKQNESKLNIQDSLSRWLPGEKVISLQSTLDAVAILRRAGGQKRRDIAQRDKRSHMVAEHAELTCDQPNRPSVLKVEGFVRGQPLSANSLVHIPGFGQYQIDLIEVLTDPTIDGTSDVVETIKPNPAIMESLTSENDVDPMDAEQTWPTPEDQIEADLARKTKKVRVPKGMSDYQAAWIPDNLLINGEEESEDESGDDMIVDDGVSESHSSHSEVEDDEDQSTAGDLVPDVARYDDKMDMEEEEKALCKLSAAKEDILFPDELDTPTDVPARIRFQKYRGLQSFRTSTWDPAENLPPEYARIFQFENYDRMRKRTSKMAEIDGVLPGRYVRIHIVGVEQELFRDWRIQCAPLVLFAMLPHEQKMSLLNVVLHNSTDHPIKSKETLIFHIGYRRFKARPIFSQHSNGNKHKYERFWQPGATVVASMYAPVIFAPSTVLVFKENSKDGTMHDLVGTGDVLSANPGRIITKRVVLSGHPFKVLKRSAVVRFMFFNREDIIWFKPVELTTRHGRRGHIKEPLGTHGHMKCSFDSQLKSQDTVFMRLYKRVFPPWSYENLTGSPLALC